MDGGVVDVADVVVVPSVVGAVVEDRASDAGIPIDLPPSLAPTQPADSGRALSSVIGEASPLPVDFRPEPPPYVAIASSLAVLFVATAIGASLVVRPRKKAARRDESGDEGKSKQAADDHEGERKRLARGLAGLALTLALFVGATVFSHLWSLVEGEGRYLPLIPFVVAIAAEMARQIAALWFIYQLLKASERLLLPESLIFSALAFDIGLIRVLLGIDSVPLQARTPEQASEEPYAMDPVGGSPPPVPPRGSERGKGSRGLAPPPPDGDGWKLRKLMGVFLFAGAIVAESVAYAVACAVLSHGEFVLLGSRNEAGQARAFVIAGLGCMLASIGAAWLCAQLARAAERLFLRYDWIYWAVRDGDPSVVRGLLGVQDPADGVALMLKNLQEVIDPITKALGGKGTK